MKSRFNSFKNVLNRINILFGSVLFVFLVPEPLVDLIEGQLESLCNVGDSFGS